MEATSGSITRLCFWVAVLLLSAPFRASAVEVGEHAPDLVLPIITSSVESSARHSGDSQQSARYPLLKLSGYQGRVVYLDFWDSYCAPCRESLPALSLLRDQYPREEFEVIGVNLDADPRQALKFLADHPVSFPVTSDPAAISADSYRLTGLPTAFLITADGRIRSVHRGYDEQHIERIKTELAALTGRR